jgi:hypothetical protein
MPRADQAGSAKSNIQSLEDSFLWRKAISNHLKLSRTPRIEVACCCPAGGEFKADLASRDRRCARTTT